MGLNNIQAANGSTGAGSFAVPFSVSSPCVTAIAIGLSAGSVSAVSGLGAVWTLVDTLPMPSVGYDCEIWQADVYDLTPGNITVDCAAAQTYLTLTAGWSGADGFEGELSSAGSASPYEVTITAATAGDLAVAFLFQSNAPPPTGGTPNAGFTTNGVYSQNAAMTLALQTTPTPTGLGATATPGIVITPPTGVLFTVFGMFLRPGVLALEQTNRVTLYDARADTAPAQVNRVTMYDTHAITSPAQVNRVTLYTLYQTTQPDDDGFALRHAHAGRR